MPSHPFPQPSQPEIHGHRGCRGLRPENTIPAFLHALKLGVDVLEMDVVISADQQVVVSHEPWLNPLICLDPAGQSIVSTTPPAFNLYQLPYSTIRQCECGRPHPAFPQQAAQPSTKPLLREVLAATRSFPRAASLPPVGYSIEIKSLAGGDNIYHPAPADFLDLVMAELDQAGVLSRTTLLCFDPRILQLAHQLYPSLRTCLLVEAEQLWLPSLANLGFVPTTFGPSHTTVTAAASQVLRSCYPRLRLVPWTVNETSDFVRLIALGVDGITTDYPDRLVSLLGVVS